jgi:hypothetical protein
MRGCGRADCRGWRVRPDHSAGRITIQSTAAGTSAFSKNRGSVVPQMDATPSQSYQPAPRPSFSDRITTCLSDAAANGLGPGEREAYSRTCANQ